MRVPASSSWFAEAKPDPPCAGADPKRLSAFTLQSSEKFSWRFNAQPVTKRREEVPSIVRDDDLSARCSRYLGNVRVVDPATRNGILCRRSYKRQPIERRQIVNRHAGKNLLF